MSEQQFKEELLNLIREIETSPAATQRNLSSKLGISLGKTNYLLKELIKKGSIKARNFSHNPGKLGKVKYILTKKGMQDKIRLTYHCLKAKEAEYNQLKEAWEKMEALVSGEKLEV